MARAAGTGNESGYDKDGRLFRHIVRSSHGPSGCPEEATGISHFFQ